MIRVTLFTIKPSKLQIRDVIKIMILTLELSIVNTKLFLPKPVKMTGL